MGGRQGRQWLAGVVGLALLMQLLFTPSPAEALSWRLPGREAKAPARTKEFAARTLREVPPPPWVQQARAALEERDPRVRILAPADGDLLPAGPWTLRLQVSDWPLVDAGPLGLGPHLVVQLDGEPPRPLVETEVRMPPLSPGSHLLTVYAAKPWGEAHKSPLALAQIRLHRLAANPATLPAPGTPQLIPVSPVGLAEEPPLLLDWLLRDTPLQGLRGDASGWRLRLTVNGESVLVDQQLPLWLDGWKPGGNALLLELLDGRGEPLNPPFNSLLREVIVPATGASGPTRPLSAPRTDLEIAVLVGEQPVSALLPPEAAAPPTPAPEASVPTEAEEASAPLASPPAESPAAPLASLSPPSVPTADGPAPTAAASGPETGPESSIEPDLESASTSEPGSSPAPEAASDRSVSPPTPEPDLGSASTPEPGSTPSSPPVAASGDEAGKPEAAAAPSHAAEAPSPPTGPEDTTAMALPANASPLDEMASLEAAPSGLASPPEASSAASPPPAARDEVNPDGTLRRPARPNPLAGLRQRLAR